MIGRMSGRKGSGGGGLMEGRGGEDKSLPGIYEMCIALYGSSSTGFS